MLNATQLWLPILAHEPTPGSRMRPGGTPGGRTARGRAQAAPATAQATPNSRAARHAYLGVAARWSLTGPEALKLLGELLCDENERHERLQGVLGAHRSLLLLAPDPARCAKLLREACSPLEGASMLRVMLAQGLPGIARVRAHLLTRLGR